MFLKMSFSTQKSHSRNKYIDNKIKFMRIFLNSLINNNFVFVDFYLFLPLIDYTKLTFCFPRREKFRTSFDILSSWYKQNMERNIIKYISIYYLYIWISSICLNDVSVLFVFFKFLSYFYVIYTACVISTEH